MNYLQITYPNGNLLQINIPENWKELRRKQFAAIAPLIYEGDVINLITRFSSLILGKLFKKIEGEENLDECLRAFAFLASFPVLEKSFYKGFRIFGRRWFGLDDRLMDMSILDFGLCEQTLNAFEAKENQKIFYGTIYKRGWLQLFPLKEKKKAALRLNYEGLRAIIPSMYPGLKSGGENKAPDYHGLIIGISAGPFGDYEKTQKAMLHDVLKYLEREAIETEKNKKA